MASFHDLRITATERDTKDSVVLSLEVPAALREAYRFAPGQYLTFSTLMGGEELRRSYSICSVPGQAQLQVGVKRVPGGRFSTHATAALKAGDTLRTMTPQGRFVLPPAPASGRTVVAFAAGSGITPIISIMEHMLSTEPASRFMLFYGNRHRSGIMFRRRIDLLKNAYMGRLSVFHILSGEDLDAELFCGRISGHKCRAYANSIFDPATVDAFMMCGPEPMVMDLRDTLRSLGVADEKVHFELFTSVDSNSGGQAAQTRAAASAADDATSQVTVVMDGHEFNLEVPYTGITILDAAARAGIDVPYSCKGAVCCTCMARVMEGKVHMTKNYSLTDGEVAAGLVLTCQAHPRTAEVIINFDEI